MFPDWFIASTSTCDFGDFKNEETIKKLSVKLRVSREIIISLKQEHTNLIFDAKNSGLIGDGLYTDKSSVVLLIKTADCVPLVIWDSTKRSVAILHVGRKGAENGFAPIGVEYFFNKGSNIKDLNFYLGPHIRKECYMMDLEKLITNQLATVGVNKYNIQSQGECTFCLKNKYFSHRRGDTARMGTYIKIL